MIFWGVVGCFFVCLLVVAIEERRRDRGMVERLRSEVLNHQRKNAMNEYHEPGTWRRRCSKRQVTVRAASKPM